MTGLAIVMLLIGLASAIFSTASREPVPVASAVGSQPPLTANITSPISNVTDPVKEPLAELGVAPSAETEALNTTTPAPNHSVRK